MKTLYQMLSFIFAVVAAIELNKISEVDRISKREIFLFLLAAIFAFLTLFFVIIGN
jgi:hypothetical protein